MKPICRYGFAFGVLLAGVLIWRCTTNPFFDDNDIATENNWIKGHVQLDNGQPAHGAAVWFEGYEMGCYVDEKGTFRLQLSGSGNLQTGAESGVFSLYVYINNYRLYKVEIYIVDGQVLNEKGGVGQNGWLKEEVILEELLNVQTISYYSFDAKMNDSLLVWETYCHAKNPPVNVRLRGRGIYSYFLMPEQDEGQSVSVFDNEFVGKRDSYISEATYKTLLSLNGGQIEMGVYQFTPWIVVLQEDIPDKLKTFVGYDFDRIDESYYNLPFVRSGGHFRIEHQPGEAYRVTEL